MADHSVSAHERGPVADVSVLVLHKMLSRRRLLAAISLRSGPGLRETCIYLRRLRYRLRGVWRPVRRAAYGMGTFSWSVYLAQPPRTNVPRRGHGGTTSNPLLL